MRGVPVTQSSESSEGVWYMFSAPNPMYVINTSTSDQAISRYAQSRRGNQAMPRRISTESGHTAQRTHRTHRTDAKMYSENPYVSLFALLRR